MREQSMREEYDFSNASRARDVPHLAKLQQEGRGKQVVTILLEEDLLEALRARAETEGVGFQALIHETLRRAVSIPGEER